MSRRTRRIAVVSSVVGLFGCSGGNQPAGDSTALVELAHLSAALLQSCDQSFQRCQCASNLGTVDGDVTCIAVDEYELSQDVTRVSEMVQRGAVRFDGHVAAVCLQELRDADCDVETPPCGGLGEVLWRSATPIVPLGGDCASAFECADGACGRRDGNAVLGTCVPDGEGDPCIVWCGDGVQVSSDGEIPASCTLSCFDGLSPTGPGKACICERTQPFGVAIGQPCADAAQPCVEDAWCDVDADVCVQRGRLGSSCIDTYARFREHGDAKWLEPSCTDGLYCDPSTSTCTTKTASGTTCDSGGPPDQCATQCGAGGRCVPTLCQ